MPVLPSACAIVTGTSSGIGQAIALKLLNEGWHVHGLDIAPTKITNPSFTYGSLISRKPMNLQIP